MPSVITMSSILSSSPSSLMVFSFALSTSAFPAAATFQVQVLAPAIHPEGQTAVVVDQRHAQRAVDVHRRLESAGDIAAREDLAPPFVSVRDRGSRVRGGTVGERLGEAPCETLEKGKQFFLRHLDSLLKTRAADGSSGGFPVSKCPWLDTGRIGTPAPVL